MCLFWLSICLLPAFVCFSRHFLYPPAHQSVRWLITVVFIPDSLANSSQSLSDLCTLVRHAEATACLPVNFSGCSWFVSLRCFFVLTHSGTWVHLAYLPCSVHEISFVPFGSSVFFGNKDKSLFLRSALGFYHCPAWYTLVQQSSIPGSVNFLCILA